MSLSRTPISPARLETVRRRLDAWRRSRRGRERIPEPLWNLAVQMAGVYGLCTTARTLRLDYVVLKRRVESANRQSPPRPEPAMSFVEVLPSERTSVPECILELEDPGGAKMRVHLKGIQVPDLTTLKHQPTRGSGAGASAGVVSDTVAVSLRPYSRQEQAATRPP